jgi:serine/threonine protein kinase
MTASLIGAQLGQYKILSELGRGQHSTVYKAWQRSLERHVALKVLDHQDYQALLRFQSEARLTAYLVDQGVTHIRQVYEVGQTADGYLFVALEFVEGSLRHLLDRARQRGLRMAPVAAARLLLPVAQALDAIHSLGWVHLDIKPQNILLNADGRAILADLGIAQKRGACTHACTPTYASPEQAAGDRPVGPWSDIYSLAAVLYEMISGHAPVRGEHDIVLLNQHLEAVPPSPRRVNPELTASQERALFRALSKAAKDRYPTAGEFVEAMLSSDTFLSSAIQTPRNLVSTTSSWVRRIPPLACMGVLRDKKSKAERALGDTTKRTDLKARQ